jgi:TonB family protein
MIRPSLLSLLVLIAASVVVHAQNSGTTSDSTSTPVSPLLACHAPTEPPPETPPERIVVSAAVVAGNKIQGKVPKYPKDAKRAHVEGTVVLRGVISKSGDIEDLCVIQGPAKLQQAAYDAVKTWKYRPYLRNGEPLEVETQVNVIFTLR